MGDASWSANGHPSTDRRRRRRLWAHGASFGAPLDESFHNPDAAANRDSDADSNSTACLRGPDLCGDDARSTDRSALRARSPVWFVDRSYAGVAGIHAVAAAVQAQVSSAATANVRFFIAANQEGGVIQAMQGPGFSQIPTAVVQGTWDQALLQSRAAVWARELSAAGINFNFAPVMDVVPPGTDAQNEPIGALQRDYGHDPATVGSHGVAFLAGMHQSGIAVSLKHFPGLGRVTGNTDFTTATDTTTTGNDPYLQSSKQGIAANADFVMVALAKYTRIDSNHLAAFSPLVMTQMLRGTMGFNGVIISDDLGDTAAVAAIPPGTRAIDFLSAGGDMIISKTSAPAHAMVLAIRSRAEADPTFRQRVDDAALRILRAKQAWSLLPC
ncbi:MAG: glycoside hydrolase family 3 protein [Chloroflexi bacterium]|nr:MAG: glycoside hydrolase family 3 protein [Chloroflexota bacterium]